MSSISESMQIYAPGTLRASQSKVIEIHANEQDHDADILVSFGNLHTIRGRVTAPQDQIRFTMGLVGVLDPKEETFNRVADLQPDGSYLIKYVPSGSYTLVAQMVAGEVTQSAGLPAGDTRRFQMIKVPVTVLDDDISVDDLRLVE